MNQKSKIKNQKKGFTLIETMIAVFILAVSVGGPLAIVTKSLQASFFARDQITAFFLAQEAVENIRNTRDQNGIQGKYWLIDIAYDELSGATVCIGPTLPSNPCSVDVRVDKPQDIQECSSGTCPPLNIDPDGFYSYASGGQPSDFTRTITVTTVPAGTAIADANEIEILVNVAWNTGVITRNFDLKEHLFNWQGGGGASLPPPPLPSCVPDEATNLEDFSAVATISGGGPNLNSHLDFNIKNLCGDIISIDSITISWTDPARGVDQIRMIGSSVWSGGPLSSGSAIDIVPDYSIPALSELTNRFEFDGDMRAVINTFTVTYRMSDGSTHVTIPSFTP